MKRWHVALSRALGFWLCLLGGPLHADERPPEDPPGLLARVGALVGELKDLENDYVYAHIRRGISAEQVDDLARVAARKMARRRDALAKLAPRLGPDSALASQLQTFLERWPDETAFRTGLLSHGRPDGVQPYRELVSMQSLAPDRRWQWKTPFPFFRP